MSLKFWSYIICNFFCWDKIRLKPTPQPDCFGWVIVRDGSDAVFRSWQQLLQATVVAKLCVCGFLHRILSGTHRVRMLKVGCSIGAIGLAVRFRSAPASAHGQWVFLETASISEARRRPVVLQHRRRMLRHNALDAWTTMLNMGWVHCGPQWWVLVINRQGLLNVIFLRSHCQCSLRVFIISNQLRWVLILFVSAAIVLDLFAINLFGTDSFDIDCLEDSFFFQDFTWATILL